MINYIRAGEVAKLFSVSPQTIMLWDKKDQFRCDYRTPGGQRMYDKERVIQYLNNQQSGNQQ